MQVNAPFGLRHANHPTGVDRAMPYTIASGYGTAIFKGDPVILNTNGTVVAGTAAADLLGVFNGVEYIDPTGKPNVSNFWPAGQAVQAGTFPVAYVSDDPQAVFEVQATGPVLQTALLDQADIVMGVGDPLTGLSKAALSATLAGVGVQGQFRIIGFSLDPTNAIGDPFTVVQVKIARHQTIANKVAV